MSVLMMNDKGLEVLAETISKILNMGFNYFGFFPPKNLAKVLDDCRTGRNFYSSEKILERLYKLNSRAYSERYKNISPYAALGEVPKPDFSGADITEHREYSNYHVIIRPWHYQILKLLDCFTYQVDDVKDELIPELNSLANILAGFIARNCDEYENIPWGGM